MTKIIDCSPCYSDFNIARGQRGSVNKGFKEQMSEACQAIAPSQSSPPGASPKSSAAPVPVPRKRLPVNSASNIGKQGNAVDRGRSEASQAIAPSQSSRLDASFMKPSPPQRDREHPQEDWVRVRDALYGKISIYRGTQVSSPSGIRLPANRISIGGINVAIACQYPTKKLLEDHLEMLIENRTPVLVVLASNDDINKLGLLEYFRGLGERKYGNVSVCCEKKGDAEIGRSAEQKKTVDFYYMRLTREWREVREKVILRIPVVHVTNWQDKTALSPDEVKELHEHVVARMQPAMELLKEKSRWRDDPKKLLPVVHCLAGLGRTGQFLAARELLLSESRVSIDRILDDMRASRHDWMARWQESALRECAQISFKEAGQ